MYTVVRRYTLDAAHFAEVVRRGEQGLVPQLSVAPGFVAYRVFQMDTGDLLSVSVSSAASSKPS